MSKKLQFIYFLRLVPRLLDESAWTEEDSQIVERHFLRLQKLTKEGTVILAGRTLDADPKGIVILEASSEEEARSLMEADPTVAEGIMTAELFPYSVALMKGAEG
ncbi:MAG TPA: hypothetical protein GXX23_05750 [Firmicutes bacterium]|nr:hypothetical protein [Candidatus Fermentithermobacillaceae bacterium]